MQTCGWVEVQLRSFMISTQDGLSARYTFNGKLGGSQFSSWLWRRRNFFAFTGKLLLYLDLREARYFCWISIMAEWQLFHFKPILYCRLHMLKLIEWELDSDKYISWWNSSNILVKFLIKYLHVTVAWCGRQAISSWRHNVAPITFVRFQLLLLLAANGMQYMLLTLTAREKVTELNL